MKTTPVRPQDIAASVFAVPPLARNADLSINRVEVKALVDHIEKGGISTLLYGGNANLYHLRVSEYAALLDVIEEASGPNTWVIPAAGPDFGKLLDQAEVLRERKFPAAMALPVAFPSMPRGVASALRRFSDTSRCQVVLYLKTEDYLSSADIGRLVDDGVICAIKYAIPRVTPLEDGFLTDLLARVDVARVACGLAEKYAAPHLLHYRLASYTSGGVCIAPRMAQALLIAGQNGQASKVQTLRESFMPLERFRERVNVFAALHEAVTQSGLANMGAQLPMLSSPEDGEVAELRPIVRQLLAAENTFAASMSTMA